MIVTFAIFFVTINTERFIRGHTWQLKSFHQTVHLTDIEVTAIITLKNIGNFVSTKTSAAISINLWDLSGYLLISEHAFEGCYDIVCRYVKNIRDSRKHQRANQDLVWEPGYAQADLGEADFYEQGNCIRKKYLLLLFPYSNDGFCQGRRTIPGGL